MARQLDTRQRAVFYQILLLVVVGLAGWYFIANAVDLGVTGATSALGLALGAVNGAFNLDMALTALENEGKLSVISTPRVSTQNNVEAEIAQGTQIPIQTVANNTVTVPSRTPRWCCA